MSRKYPGANPHGRQEGDYPAAEDHRRVLAVLTYLRRQGLRR
jgi:hypothetical protein